MEYLPVSDESIKRAADVIRAGGLAAFPTETVYGLGADAFNADAIVKIFDAKGRPRFDPLIIHIANISALNDVANLSLLSEENRRRLDILTKKFWPGPLSIVLPKSENIPGIATAGLDTAAVRFPANETARALIKLAGGAVAAPSANPFGALSPTRAEHVKDGLGGKIDIILDGGPCAVGVESAVLDLTGDTPRLLRHGGVAKEEIEEAINEQLAICNEQLNAGNEQGSASPGMLKSHYAPKTPLEIINFNAEDASNLRFANAEDEKDIAWLFFDEASCKKYQKKIRVNPCNQRIYILSKNGDVNEAAARLFETLRKMDKLGAKRICAELAPSIGLGAAINDRLLRASVK